MFAEKKIYGAVYIPSTDRVLVSVESYKLYLVNHMNSTYEQIVPSQPFTKDNNIFSLSLLDEHFALVRDQKFMYVVDTLKKKAFRLFNTPYSNSESSR